MKQMYTLGIDIGTTGLKAVALHRERGIVAQAARPHELISMQSGWAEEDTEQWWMTTREAIRELLTKIPAQEIAAIGVSGMVPALILLDASGQPIRPSIQQNDARTIAEVAQLRTDVDAAEFFAVTGSTVNQQNIDPRWRWLQSHEPEHVRRTSHLCGSYDYITYRLTGVLSLEENWAAESALYDVRTHRWHTPYLEHAGIQPSLLPPVRLPSEVVGGIGEEVAKQTGLRVGTPAASAAAT